MITSSKRLSNGLILVLAIASPALAQDQTQESENKLSSELTRKLVRCAAGWGCENMAHNQLEAEIALDMTKEQAQAEARKYGFEEPLLEDVILQCASGFDCLVEDLNPRDAAKLLPEEDAALQCAAGYGCEHTTLTEENAQKMLDMSAQEAKAEFQGRVNTSGGQMRPTKDDDGFEFSEKDLTSEDLSEPLRTGEIEEMLDKAPKESWGDSFYEKCVEWVLEQPWSKILAYQTNAIQSCKDAAKRGEVQYREDWKRVEKELRERSIIRK